MSGPYDKPDDPDEVTLWAGRLRPWPTAPVDSEQDDADETVVARRRRSGGADDDTLIARRRGDDDTVRVDHAGGGEEQPVAAEVIDDTAPGSRMFVDDTVRSARGTSADDDTAPRLRTEVDETARSPRTVQHDHETAPGSRGSRDALPSRDASSRGLAPAADDAPTAPRPARVPDPDAAETYRPRIDDAVRVQRSAPAPRGGPERDPALVRARSSRRGALAPLVIGGTTVAVIAGALAVFLALAR
ncbi:hypothetical protein P2P98_14935 [Microbacterium sp. Kw_RZR3]|uniref:hypothetical protein n=1 Tax=Microbacterium sp. Kw_RZR3 TaxID=3032903 RepID=UPI0023D9BDB4|nr:hypothetical protein [Microbacterium sp. Kw_RZR3]MDF2047460.1 hypothetical protein [Microbacterium sp. Kw_RZR3]